MFVQAEIVINCPFGEAEAGLATLSRSGWLTQASEAAYESGLTGLARVGPLGDVPGLSKLVQVHVRDVLARDDGAVLTLRWEATGPGGALFPALDADVTVTAAGQGQSRLTLNGAYRPPLAGLGAGLDRLILNRVATATARSLLDSIAAAICGDPACSSGALAAGSSEARAADPQAPAAVPEVPSADGGGASADAGRAGSGCLG